MRIDDDAIRWVHEDLATLGIKHRNAMIHLGVMGMLDHRNIDSNSREDVLNHLEVIPTTYPPLVVLLQPL